MSLTLNRRRWLAAGTALAAPALLRAQPATRIQYGYSAVTDFATVFVAADKGFFARRGLEVELKFIPVSPTILPAVQSGSLQMGGPTPTSYLQGVAGGLDHVVIAGGGALSKSFTEVGLVTKAGSGLRSAADCVGRRIGVPGIGALLHVSFRQWLKMNGVDQSKVVFVEAAFPQHADMLRGGTVDAVVTAGPFMSRILASGEGRVAAYFTTFLPEGMPTVVHTATREWAERNPAAVKAFREGVAEAAVYMASPAHNAELRASLGKYLKVPPEVANSMQISPAQPQVLPKHLQWWGALMREQGYLKSEMNYNALIAKG